MRRFLIAVTTNDEVTDIDRIALDVASKLVPAKVTAVEFDKHTGKRHVHDTIDTYVTEEGLRER